MSEIDFFLKLLNIKSATKILSMFQINTKSKNLNYIKVKLRKILKGQTTGTKNGDPFKGKDNDIEIAYDSLIKNMGSGFTIGSANHTRPDIRLSLYDKDGEIKRTIIVEVKCRDGKCVYHRGSKVEKQLRDYRYGFRYGEDEKDIVKQVIMICLLTDNYKEEFEIKNRSIIGLPLEITNEKNIPRGYRDLVKNIDKFLLKD